MIKKILFDIDGTLICNVDFAKYTRNAFHKYGITDELAIWKFCHSYQAYEIANGKYDRELFAKYMSNRVKYNLNQKFVDILFEELSTAVNGDAKKLKEMLNKFKDCELILISNYFEYVQRNRLDQLGINEYFKKYYGEKVCKPRLTPFLEALGDTYPEECMMIGDNYEADIKPAQSIGINTIQIGRDISSITNLTPEYVDYIVKSK